MKQLLFLSIFLSSYLTVFSQDYTISGYITDDANGEELIGAAIKVKGTTMGAVTNVYGYYALTLPQGNYEISFDFIGYAEKLNQSI